MPDNTFKTSSPMALLDHLRRLRSACVVAALGSSARAAQAMHLSQSSVVRAVQELETAMGMALFERSARGMQVNLAAQPLLARAERALQHLAAVSCMAARTGERESLAWLDHRLAQGVGKRHVSVMLTLVQMASETRGAQGLGISQSAVHQTLVQLEHMAGERLFVRARKGLRLTETGEAVLKAIKLCMDELRLADEELALRSGVMQGRLTIGTLPFSTGRLLALSVGQVSQAYPGLAITVVDGTYDALLHQLRHAEIDMIVGALRPDLPGPDLTQESLFIDSLAVMARAGHPLAARETLEWEDLRTAQWILPMPNTPAQAAFEQTLQAAGLPQPPNTLRVNSALMMRAMLEHSDRLAMMAPRQLQREMEAGLLVELKLPVRHDPRMIGLIRRTDYLPTSAGRLLFESFRLTAREMASEPVAKL